MNQICFFKEVKLKDPQKTMECINIDDYYVNCVEAVNIEYMEVELQEHKKKNTPGEIKRITPQKERSPKTKIPILEYGSPLDHTTKRELQALK